MKILRLLIVAILAMPLALCGENIDDLPYDYVETIKPKFTKKKARQIAKRKMDLQKVQKEPNGFFVGIGGLLAKPSGNRDGYSRDITIYIKYTYHLNLPTFPPVYIGNPPTITRERIYATYNPTDVDVGLSILLGYKHFFGDGTWGLREYLDYNARFLDLLTSHNFTFNIDILANFIKTKDFKFGIIVGMGYGLVYERVNKDYCTYFKDCDIVGESIKGNFGLRFVIKDNSAIEVLFQPQYSGKLFAYMQRQNSYSYGPRSNIEDLLNGISETAMIGTIRFIYTF